MGGNALFGTAGLAEINGIMATYRRVDGFKSPAG